jgi:hypothetical protein
VTVFVVRVEVLAALQADPVWFERAKRCKNATELQVVMVDFGRFKGFGVKEVMLS